MSARENTAGITFSIRPETRQEQFKLLELPSDLLSDLTSNRPPTLQFKSQRHDNTSNATDQNVVLCTDNKTYRVQQVNHSNSFFLTRPRHFELEHVSDVLPAGLEAVATSSSILELIPTKQSDGSANAYLHAILPVFTTETEIDHDHDTSRLSPTAHHDEMNTDNDRRKNVILSHCPWSQAESEQAWRDLTCFELSHRNEGIASKHRQWRSYRPSSSAYVQAWTELLAFATAEVIDLTTALPRSFLEDPDEIGSSGMLGSIANDAIPSQLFRAVLSGLAEIESSGDEVYIDKARCISKVGVALLEHHAQISKAITLQGFLRAWADTLPEAWRKEAKIEVLEGNYRLENGGRDVVFAGHSLNRSGLEGSSSNDLTKPTPTGTANSSKRKWHEKFQAQRKK